MILTSSGKPLDGLSLLQAEAKSKAEAKPKAEPKEPGQEARVERKGPKSTVWKQGDAGPDIRSIDVFFFRQHGENFKTGQYQKLARVRGLFRAENLQTDGFLSVIINNVKHENEGDADEDDPSYNAKNKQRTWKKTNNSKFWTESANPQQMQCFRAIDRVNQQHENDWEHLSVSNRPFQMGIAKAAEKFEPPARKEEEPVELPPEVGNSETGGI